MKRFNAAKKKMVLCVLLLALLTSCNSNRLMQADAEKVIKEYLSNNPIEISGETLNSSSIKKIGATNIFSQFNTSIRVFFDTMAGQEITLLFIFTRTPKNKWFLKSIEEDKKSRPELADRVSRKKLHIPVH